MLVENYPVGWAIDAGKPEPFLAYLIDLPGIAMQGPTMDEALKKLRAVTFTILTKYRQEGVALPEASLEPSLEIGAITWSPV